MRLVVRYHTIRDRPTPNANPQQTPNNEHSLQNAESVMTAIKDKLPEKEEKMRFYVSST